MTTEKPLAHQLQDRVYSSLGMLEQQDLSEDNPELPGILVLATTLNEKLSELTGIESVTDASASAKTSIGDRLFQLGGDAESVAVIAGMLAAHVAGEGKEAECMLYIIEREGYRLQEAINSVWSDHERESASVFQSEGRTLLESFQSRCANLSGKECAQKLRGYLWDVSENIAADDTEDGFTVTHTWTLKGLRYQLAREMFLESLLPAEDGEGAH